MAWHDARRTLNLQLADGSRMLAPTRRTFEVSVGQNTQSLVFDGKPVTVSF
jgi:hypothetical protein